MFLNQKTGLYQYPNCKMRYLLTVVLVFIFTTTKAQTQDTIKVHLQLSKRTSPHLIFENAYQVLEIKDNISKPIKFLDANKQEYPPKTIIWKIEKDGWL